MIKQNEIYKEIARRLKEKGVNVDYRVVGHIMTQAITLVKKDMEDDHCWGPIELPYIGTFIVKKRYRKLFPRNENKASEVSRDYSYLNKRNRGRPKKRCGFGPNETLRVHRVPPDVGSGQRDDISGTD